MELFVRIGSHASQPVNSRDVTKFEFERWQISNNFTTFDEC